jgi:hypothetical protein
MADKVETESDNKVETGLSEKEGPVSVRESILEAVKEHTESDSVSKDKNIENIKGEGTDTKVEGPDGKVESEIVETDESDKAKKVAAEKEDKEDKEDKAPSILPKEIQSDWASLPSATKTYVSKVQKELADAKANLGRHKDMDAAIAPFLPAIQQWGATPAQTVSALFQWMDALSGPNKVSAIEQLAYNFGMDLAEIYAPIEQADNTNQNQNQNQNQDYREMDPRWADTIGSMYQEVSQLKQQQEKARWDNTANYINNWAGLQTDGSFKNKPHFNEVRQVMFSLLSTGAIPLVNGQLDLDTAYDHACYSVPEVRQALMAEQQKATQEAEKAAKAKKAAEDRARVAKARSLDMGLKPTSPTDNAANNSKPNGKVSVRESIRQAMSELNN